VLRGPQSGLYGSDAIGGVVNIITKSGNGPLALSVEAEGGSFDTFNQSASASGSQDEFHYRVSLAHLHAGATPVTPLDLLPPGQQQPVEGHRRRLRPRYFRLVSFAASDPYRYAQLRNPRHRASGTGSRRSDDRPWLFQHRHQ
jgi:outer membrane receptor protein involved in Fe transport